MYNKLFLHDNDADCVGNLFVSTFLFIYFLFILWWLLLVIFRSFDTILPSS